MSIHNTVIHSSGEILTGRLWRKEHRPFFNDLPFFSNIPRMDDMAGPLMDAFDDGRGRCYKALLIKFAKGLDEGHPFSDTNGVDLVIMDSKRMLSPNIDAVPPKNASRIWGFVSKFVMLDRFTKALFGRDFHPGINVPKKICKEDYLGTAVKILDDLRPATKLIEKFIKTWGDRQTTRAQYFETVHTTPSNNTLDQADIVLKISRRLINVVKVKNIVHIEAGFEMVALALTISTENNGVFPELASDVTNILRRIWLDRMEQSQFEEISQEILALHKPMRHIIQLVFATSPLLVLSTHGWGKWKATNGTYLLRTFVALGNNRPQILVDLEDKILEGILAIMDGTPTENVLDTFYSAALLAEKDIRSNVDAMKWFDLLTADISMPSTPPPSVFPSTPSTAAPPIFFAGASKASHTVNHLGLASPPASLNNSPFPIGSTKASQIGTVSPCRFVNPKDLVSSEYFGDEDGGGLTEQEEVGRDCGDKSGSIAQDVDVERHGGDESDLMEQDIRMLDGDEADSIHRSKRSEYGDDADPRSGVEIKKHSLHSLEDENVESANLVEPREQSLCLSKDERDLREVVELMESLSESKEEVEEGMDDRMEPSSQARDEGDRDHLMVDVEPKEPLSDSMEVEGEGCPAVEVNLKKSSNTSEDLEPSPKVHSEAPLTTIGPKSGSSKETLKMGFIQTQPPRIIRKPNPNFINHSDDQDSDSSVQAVAPHDLRRSTRNANKKNMATLKLATSQKFSSSRRKQSQKKDEIFLPDDSEDERPKLCDVEKAEYHATLYTDIVGWGSTVDAGSKPYRHIPVQIVPPGNVASTGDDTETLRKVEALIQAEFKNGLPPHLQSNAKSLSYSPGTDQSRIFVASHSEFTGLHARDVQKILRERVILVHGNPLDYSYGWDLDSFGRLYDVDRKATVHVATLFDHQNPELRHHQGTLRELHAMTTTLSNDDCPPLNAISLPVHPRNLFIPCQFGSLASHEVAQSRVPPNYEARFEVSGVKSLMEWCLIGGRGAISPFHVDSDGLGTVVVVLEGSKYWILATRLGDQDTISSIDSLGPGWNPYLVNDGENVNRFRFEAVHLQKGDMLIMPGGIPHWVLGTSNSICVGRHFYGASTIRSSVIAIVHTFLLAGALTNEDLLETRTFLYQLLVFWSTRLDKRDVDGAHIPDFSSEVEFFDVLYLGVFIILSPAFDNRFYRTKNPPANIVAEVFHAKRHVYSLFHIFSTRFIVVLEGEVVSHSYVVDRMLAEFAAAAVNFSRAIDETNVEGDSDSDDGGENGITTSLFVEMIEDILKESHSQIFPYYSNLLVGHHKHFVWTGPKLQIIPRSLDILSILPLMTLGEKSDLPGHQIYNANLDPEPASTDISPLLGKRSDKADDPNPSDEISRKRQRLL